MNIFLAVVLAITVLPSTIAQPSGRGEIRIFEDPRIEQLVQKHVLINETREGIPGYRIQIFFDSGTNSKLKAQVVCDDFRTKYTDHEAYLTFISPNYKVRVGDFRTRLDAVRFLQQLQLDYPNAYVVSDLIKFPKIE
ncbi:MAG: SPOR domain-containing protein [bacterium]